jgi:predicted membrane channel-forming protein YqfA (hemolysin III family)
MKGLGVAGLVAIAAGVLCILVGAIFFILGYPQDWIASISDTGKYAASRALIERVVLFLGFGITLLFFGVSAFFYGRTVLGSGHLDQFSTKEVEVET